MRPKLLAIKVGGCYLILVILRASSRRQATVGSHRRPDAT
jgi:hypothetical protein